MKFSVITPDELEPSLRQAWLRLCGQSDRLYSPYFAPEFTMAVGAVRRDTFVTVVEDGNAPVLFFPFQRGRFGAGQPAGGPLSDYHGVVAADDRPFSVPVLLRESGLGYWEFDHLIAGHRAFAEYETAWSVSPALDLSRGFGEYRTSRLREGRQRIVQLERKARKISREVGPLRFDVRTLDRQALACVFRWKSEQCLRTGVPDFFSHAWTRELVERILDFEQPHFSGVLSALYAGDDLVAAHVGMRTTRVWHWWFPVYDHAFARYSPGGLLLLHVAEAAAASGCTLLDLGKGDDAYKESFADLEIPLASGCAARPSVAASLRTMARATEERLRASPVVAPAKPVLRMAKNWLRRRAYA